MAPNATDAFALVRSLLYAAYAAGDPSSLPCTLLCGMDSNWRWLASSTIFREQHVWSTSMHRHRYACPKLMPQRTTSTTSIYSTLWAMKFLDISRPALTELRKSSAIHGRLYDLFCNGVNNTFIVLAWPAGIYLHWSVLSAQSGQSRSCGSLLGAQWHACLIMARSLRRCSKRSTCTDLALGCRVLLIRWWHC